MEPQYRACLARMPDDARLRYGLAELLRGRGDAEAAVALLEPLLARPAGAEAHDQTGMALAEAGRFTEAAGRFRMAVTLDPAQPVFRGNLAMMLKIEGQFDACLDAYDEALAREPDNRQIRVNRAVARLHAGRFAEAWQDQEMIVLAGEIAAATSSLALFETNGDDLFAAAHRAGCERRVRGARADRASLRGGGWEQAARGVFLLTGVPPWPVESAALGTAMRIPLEVAESAVHDERDPPTPLWSAARRAAEIAR